MILKDGERFATIAFKFPADGTGRLYAYVHWIGMEMVRGFAAGGGYDKRSAACRLASAKVQTLIPRGTTTDAPLWDFIIALRNGDNGAGWEQYLRDAGFTVWQAV